MSPRETTRLPPATLSHEPLTGTYETKYPLILPGRGTGDHSHIRVRLMDLLETTETMLGGGGAERERGGEREQKYNVDIGEFQRRILSY